jgi:hypothetical protein
MQLLFFLASVIIVILGISTTVGIIALAAAKTKKGTAFLAGFFISLGAEFLILFIFVIVIIDMMNKSCNL